MFIDTLKELKNAYFQKSIEREENYQAYFESRMDELFEKIKEECKENTKIGIFQLYLDDEKIFKLLNVPLLRQINFVPDKTYVEIKRRFKNEKCSVKNVDVFQLKISW